MSEPAPSSTRCPWCGHLGPVVAVHGHEQCASCGTNIGPCCAGADPASEADATTAVDAGPAPELFAQLFDHLGGRDATVADDALLFALVQRLGHDLDEARLVVEAAERVGILVPVGSGAHRLRTPR